MTFTICDEVFNAKQLLLEELKDFFLSKDLEIDKYNSYTFSDNAHPISYKEILVNSNYFKINPEISIKCSKNHYTYEIYNEIFKFL